MNPEQQFHPKCRWCGRFMKLDEGHHHFIPDNHFGPEEEWWEHDEDKCPARKKEQK